MELSADALAALEMALNSNLWFSGPRMKVQVSELMCKFANQKSDGIRRAYETVSAENEELKLQVSALTQALETQKRENQPYIKELERQITLAKSLLLRSKAMMWPKFRPLCGEIKLLLSGVKPAIPPEWIPVGERLPEELIPILTLIPEEAPIPNILLNATGGDKPEQE